MSSQNLLIRRRGSLIEISVDGTQGPPRSVCDLLTGMLTYTHKRLLRGAEQYDAGTGERRTMEFEQRAMFTYEGEGRLVTGFGFLTRIVGALQGRGYILQYQDLSPHPDPTVYTPDWDNVYAKIPKFRPRQEECLNNIANNPCGLIDAACGFGKTFIFEALVHLFPRAKFDIVVGPKDVATRIMRQLTGSCPNVGLVGNGAHCIGDRVTVYTAMSAKHSPGTADFLLVDEAHQLMTDHISQVLGSTWRFSKNFGFTATPEGRMDGAHAQLEMFFGQTIFKLIYQEAVKLGLVVPIEVRWLPIRIPNNPVAKISAAVPRMRWGIWRNDQRNEAIAKDVRTNYPDMNTQILILAATLDHAIRLAKLLPEFALCYGSKIDATDLATYKSSGLLPQNFREVTPKVREEMRHNFEIGKLKRVIATDVWATGVDFANLQVLYRVDARESEILDTQGPARVSRISKDEEKQCGEVIDCWDGFDPGFLRKSRTRKSHYTKLGWAHTGWPLREI